MNVSKLFRALLLGVAALGIGTGGAFAVCGELGGYALFQCADLAYFPPPVPGFVPEFNDPNDPLRVTNITATFWQIGFGNNLVNTGAGAEGTGNSGLTAFNGNDSGLFTPQVAEASQFDTGGNIPFGAVCLANNNFGNFGIDGCCDNPRSATLPNPPNDDILNPFYNVYYGRSGGTYYYGGLYSLDWQQDYPIAVLLKTMDSGMFAIAAVATMDRGNDGSGTNGDTCAGIMVTPGTNPAPCDVRTGFYTFKGITNGTENPATPGIFNVVPWQKAPRPKAACMAGCTGTTSPRTIDFVWDTVKWYHDGTIRPTTTPTLAPNDATRAAGTGVVDLLRKTNVANNWIGLARYDLENAAVGASNLDPNGRIDYTTLTWTPVAGHMDIVQPNVGADGNPAPGTVIARSGLTVNPDTCFRVKVKLGKKPETNTTNTANCRLGKCGDRGYEVASVAPGAITCIGGPLASEQATNVMAQRAKGKILLTWDMTSELSVTTFDIFAVTTKGEKQIGTVNCKECSTGAGASYTYEASTSTAKGGVKAIKLVVNSLSPQTVQVPLL